MAFEAYLQQDKASSSRGRRVTYVVSAALHAIAVLSAIAYSFWHVEELSPPTVTVTFVSAAAPPPPPPPPPLGGGSPSPAATKHKAVVRPKVEIPKTAQIVQPKKPEKKQSPTEHPPEEAPKEPAGDDKSHPGPALDHPGTSDGTKGGVAGGVSGGTVGGTPGGKNVGSASAAPKLVPPLIGAQQKLSGAEPDFPTYLRTTDANYAVLVKVCVTIVGTVDSLTLLKRAHPTLDNNTMVAVKNWRFRPLMVNGTPAPFCFVARHEFKAQ